MPRVSPRLNEIPRPARVVLPRCLNPTAVVVMPPTGVPHELAWDPSVQRFRCIACWASSHCKLELYRSPCPAPHGFGHIVMRTGRYVFCKLCGSYSSTNVGHLHRLCNRRPKSTIAKTRLGNLMQGLDPNSKQSTGPVLPALTRLYDELGDPSGVPPGVAWVPHLVP